MSFKDDINDDIKKVFLNTDEMADEIEYDGLQISAVIDLNDGREPLLKETSSLNTFKWDRRFSIAMEDLARKPAPGDFIRINRGEYQEVVKVDEEMGMYVVYLTGNES